MPFTEQQLESPSHNVPLDDPAWAEATLDMLVSVLAADTGLSREEIDRQFPDVVRLEIVEGPGCGYGPKDTVQQVLWSVGAEGVRMWRMRPGSGYKRINVGTPKELPGEQGHPHQHDSYGLALQLGKLEEFEGALAKARAVTDADAVKDRGAKADGPKAKRLGIKARGQALRDELSGAAEANRRRQQPPAPVGRPEGRP